jgi:phage regulator Rha-like protein
MSSKEISDLLGNRHDKVKQSIERLADKGIFELPPMGEHQTETSHGRKHTVEVYLCDKRTSMIVVAQLCPEATAKIVDRWQELEEEKANGGFGVADFDDPAFQLGYIQHLTAKVEESKAKIKEQAIQIETLDETVTQQTQELDAREQMLRKLLGTGETIRHPLTDCIHVQNRDAQPFSGTPTARW